MNATIATGAIEGELRKRTALSILRQRRAAIVRLGQRALLQHLLDHGSGTADDVRNVVELPAGINPKVFGSIPGPLAEAGLIRLSGYRPSRRPKAHARPIAVWTLVDPVGAADWLANNPPLPEPENLSISI